MLKVWVLSTEVWRYLPLRLLAPQKETGVEWNFICVANIEKNNFMFTFHSLQYIWNKIQLFFFQM